MLSPRLPMVSRHIYLNDRVIFADRCQALCCRLQKATRLEISLHLASRIPTHHHWPTEIISTTFLGEARRCQVSRKIRHTPFNCQLAQSPCPTYLEMTCIIRLAT